MPLPEPEAAGHTVSSPVNRRISRHTSDRISTEKAGNTNHPQGKNQKALPNHKELYYV